MDETLVEVARAYEGVEDAASFPDRAAVEAYRAAALRRSAEQADVVAAAVAAPARAIEVGCGNGRLLVELARRGIVERAVGIDVAGSRIAFAREWAADEGFDGLRFDAADALAADLGSEQDLAVCITGALGYFGAASPRVDGALLERLRGALRRGGTVVLEVYPQPELRRLLEHTGGEARVWHELPPSDPWRFYLSHYVLRDAVLRHAKTFVHRHTGEVDEGRREAYRLYDAGALTALLEASGFEAVDLREGWTEQPYAGGELLVALARAVS